MGVVAPLELSQTRLGGLRFFYDQLTALQLLLHGLSGLLFWKHYLALSEKKQGHKPPVVYFVEVGFFFYFVQFVVVEHRAHNLVT